MIKKNSKGQTADTLTWIVATLIILLLLVFFIFGASMLGSTRVVEGKFKESLISKSVENEADLFLKKSIITYYSLTNENDKKTLNKELTLLNTKDNFKGNYTTEFIKFGGLLSE